MNFRMLLGRLTLAVACVVDPGTRLPAHADATAPQPERGS
jgi:hypothetical protein